MTARRRGLDYVAARSAWLSAAKETLAADERVVAVLLEGSLGRGAGDEWSDLDLVVVLEDAVAAEFLDARLDWVTQFGDVLLVLDSPWNATRTGAQINALYEVGSPMPLYVDWSLWPAAIAATPSDVRVLVARAASPIPEARVTMDEFRRWPRQAVSDEVRASRHARFAMLPIIGKCIGRGDGVRAGRMLTRIGTATCDPSDRTAQLDALRGLIGHLGIEEPERVVRRLDAMCDALKMAVSDTNSADG